MDGGSYRCNAIALSCKVDADQRDAIPMTGATFDTLAAARTLKQAGVEAEHAEAIADQLRVAAGADRDQLATKIDLSQLETRMTNRLYAVSAGIVGSNIAIAGVIVALTA